jgi:hypothetical protein
VKKRRKKRKEKSEKDKNSGISLFRRVFHEVVLIESDALETLPTSGTSF